MNTHHTTIKSITGVAAVWALIIAATLLLLADFANFYLMLASKLAVIALMALMPYVWRWAAERSDWVKNVERYIDEED